MSTQPSEIDAEVLDALYWGEGLPPWRIAERLDIPRRDVVGEITKRGVDKRAAGPSTNSDTNPVRMSTSERGYVRIRHSFDGDAQRLYSHQLVAIADGADPHKVFSGEWHTHHVNEVKWDNRPDNLEVMKASEHMRHHANKTDLGELSQEYTDEEMFSWLDAFVEQFGIVPSCGDIDGWPGPTAEGYRYRFGTFKKALKAAGHTPRSERGDGE